MKAYAPYARGLEKLASALLQGEGAPRERLHEALNGEASSKLRDLVPLSVRRTSGAFFTSSDLRERIARDVRQAQQSPTVLDPTCGAGDLLVAATASLPAGATVAETLSLWADRLHGWDIHEEFLHAARARLAIAAALRSARLGKTRAKLRGFLPNLVRRNALEALKEPVHFTHMLVNPPFTAHRAPKRCSWAQGRISAAASFLARAVDAAPKSARISAILPDVLRTGPRYSAWRKHVETKATLTSMDVVGRFDDWTDIDVFCVSLTLEPNGASRNGEWVAPSAASALAGIAEISIGAVVPFRDAQRGKRLPYLTTDSMPRWGAIRAEDLPTRKFDGTISNPPFVAVRRMSRPEDVPRAIATLVLGSSPVAVENHVIVVKPNVATSQRCDEIMQVLKGEEATRRLLEANRCRHLTAAALRSIPWIPHA